MENIGSNSYNNIILDEDASISDLKCRPRSCIQSADLAPVHTAKNYLIKMSEIERKINTETDKLSHNLSTNIQEKLNISKSKNFNKNGMNLRLGTTDVEVHCGAQEKSVDFQGKPVMKTSLPQSYHNSSPISSQDKANKNPHTGLCSNISKPNSCCINIITNYKSDSTITSSSNGSVCNGYAVSEATSSNSLAISDFSLSSDKSTSLDSFSCPGARPRTRNTSNSSSQSIQPQSECEVDLHTTSDSCILLSLETNLSPVPISISPSISKEDNLKVEYVNYENEHQMEAIMRLIQKDLSEPYSIYTYRYFIHNWPKLCFLAMISGEVVGAIVCKLGLHKNVTLRGYIAMLAVDHRYRKRRIGSNLVQRAIREMAADDADEVVLETEITNKSALQLYENLGFVRDKRLFRYYLNGVDALRLKLWLS